MRPASKSNFLYVNLIFGIPESRVPRKDGYLTLLPSPFRGPIITLDPLLGPVLIWGTPNVWESACVLFGRFFAAFLALRCLLQGSPHRQ